MRAMTKKLLVLIMIAVLSLSATFATANFDLDVDDDGKTEALTDGLLVIRYLFGFSGESLVAGAVSNNASRSTAADIEAYLKANEIQLDADGDGEVAALTDGLLIIRSLFGFSGTSLSAGAIATNALRKNGAAVATYLGTITDSDNDGSNNAFDAFPMDPKEWLDTDKDGFGDNADLLLPVLRPLPASQTDFNFFPIARTQLNAEVLYEFSSPLWAIEYLAQSLFLITQKTGELHLLDAEKKSIATIDLNQFLDISHSGGQDGLFDVESITISDGEYWLYVSFAEVNNLDRSRTQLSLAKLRVTNYGSTESRLISSEVIYRGPNYDNTCHYGGAISRSDNLMFLSHGDRCLRDLVQNSSEDLGVILRMNFDGSIPAANLSNDFQGTPQSRLVFSKGHRNPQGSDWSPELGQLLISEHGPRGGDEISVITGGQNYGWPLVSNGFEYSSDAPVGVPTATGYQDSFLYLTPSIAPRSLKIYRGTRFSELDMSILTTSLNSGVLIATVNSKEGPKSEIIYSSNYRLSGLAIDSAGDIYLATNDSTGAILKLIK